MKNKTNCPCLLGIFCLMAFLISCSEDSVLEMSENIREEKLLFDEKFAATRCVASNAIKLVGYASVSYNDEERKITQIIWEEYRDSINQAGCFFAASDGSVALVYSMLKDAILELDGKMYYADKEGYLKLDYGCRCEKLRVVGANASEFSVKTKLMKPLKAERFDKVTNTLFFYLGERQFACSTCTKKMVISALEDNTQTPIPCTENHKPHSNCTAAFYSLVATGRCVTKWDRCMDYNGWGTDCKGSHLYFVGSDCSFAMGYGHCWNEIGMAY